MPKQNNVAAVLHGAEHASLSLPVYQHTDKLTRQQLKCWLSSTLHRAAKICSRDDDCCTYAAWITREAMSCCYPPKVVRAVLSGMIHIPGVPRVGSCFPTHSVPASAARHQHTQIHII